MIVSNDGLVDNRLICFHGLSFKKKKQTNKQTNKKTSRGVIQIETYHAFF